MTRGIIEEVDEVGNSFLELSVPHSVSYRVTFCDGLLEGGPGPLSQYCTGRKALVCVDSGVSRLYGRRINQYFSQQRADYGVVEVRASEKKKNVESVLELCEHAIQLKLGRRSVFFAIGGGVTMDVVGLAAQLYRRMVPYVRIPTTLTGFIDAGVGVKVGVNFGGHKNLLGAFYPPFAVLNDFTFLQTLGQRQLRCGLAEIVKIAMVRNERLFEEVEHRYADVLDKNFDNEVRAIIRLAARDMLRELQPNLFERNLRRLSDFGHFFGHVLEPISDYRLAHGEAVAIDILISTYIAYKRKACSGETLERITKLLKGIGLPLYVPACEPSRVWERLDEVIAHRGGTPNLVIPSSIGRASFTDRLTYQELEAAVSFLRSL